MTDWDRVDELTLALMHLTSFTDHGVTRTWKGHDWDVLRRLFDKGLISDPVSKAKSVVLTEEGERLSLELFLREFGSREPAGAAGSGLCECGCGASSESPFRPGHDQKLRAALERRVGGLLTLRDLLDLTEDLVRGGIDPETFISKARQFFKGPSEE